MSVIGSYSIVASEIPLVLMSVIGSYSIVNSGFRNTLGINECYRLL